MPAFPPQVRLRRPHEYQAVLKGGRRLNEPLLTAVVTPNGKLHARLGLAISARAVPTAVGRNRIKRRARDSFRLNRERLPPLDVVILARPAAAGASAAELQATLERLWTQACSTFSDGCPRS